MLKENVTYTDFDGEEKTETLYFNLSKPTLVANLDLQDEFLGIQKYFEGEQRSLTAHEIRDILELVKRMMRLSYGERSEKEGKIRFRQTPEVWDDFVSSAAYETFLFSLFQDAQKLLSFITGVFPADLLAEATEEAKKQQPDLFREDQPEITSASPFPEDNRPLWERENRKPRPAELQAMSKEELEYAYSKRAAQ